MIELNRSRNNVVLSRRAVLEDERKEVREQILGRLQPGQVVEGKVSNIVDFGAFVDLEGIDGLIHISEISWSHVNHPSEVLKIGETVKVKVLDIDRDRQRISLGLKQTQEDPWQTVLNSYGPGSSLSGKVTKVVAFGAFVEIVPGVEGLVHISELAEHHVETPGEVVQPGEEVRVKILEIDEERRRISLSIKRVGEGGMPLRDAFQAAQAGAGQEAPRRRRARPSSGSPRTFSPIRRRLGVARSPTRTSPPPTPRSRPSRPPRRRRRAARPRRTPRLRSPRPPPPRKRRSSGSPRGRAAEAPEATEAAEAPEATEAAAVADEPAPDADGDEAAARPSPGGRAPAAEASGDDGDPRTTTPEHVPDPSLIGLTGGIAAGKSEALRILGELGAETISTDAIVHELLGTDEVRDRAGRALGRRGRPRWRRRPRQGWRDRLRESGGARLARVRLHPLVGERVIAWRRELPDDVEVAVVEVPLLFEGSMAEMFDATIAISAGRRRARAPRRRAGHRGARGPQRPPAHPGGEGGARDPRARERRHPRGPRGGRCVTSCRSWRRRGREPGALPWRVGALPPPGVRSQLAVARRGGADGCIRRWTLIGLVVLAIAVAIGAGASTSARRSRSSVAPPPRGHHPPAG